MGSSQNSIEQLVEQRPFTSSQSLRQSLEYRRQALQQRKTHDQYLLFTSVPKAEFSSLSEDLSQASKFCRFSYNSETGTLVTKVMPTPEHEIAAATFQNLIFLELHAMDLDDEVDTLNTMTVTIGSWKKQADCCWAPASQSTALSLVAEVGLSESSQKLAIDARGWLEISTLSVQLVITIEINRQTPEVIIHRWELRPRQYPLSTRSSPFSARRTATLKLSHTNNATSVTGESQTDNTTTTVTQLDLPFEKVVGRPPNPPHERDFVISEQQLRKFGEKIWRKQGFL